MPSERKSLHEALHPSIPKPPVTTSLLSVSKGLLIQDIAYYWDLDLDSVTFVSRVFPTSYVFSSSGITSTSTSFQSAVNIPLYAHITGRSSDNGYLIASAFAFANGAAMNVWVC